MKPIRMRHVIDEAGADAVLAAAEKKAREDGLRVVNRMQETYSPLGTVFQDARAPFALYFEAYGACQTVNVTGGEALVWE